MHPQRTTLSVCRQCGIEFVPGSGAKGIACGYPCANLLARRTSPVIVDDDGTVKLPLRRRDGSIRAYTIIDAADAEWASQWSWFSSKSGYAARQVRVDTGGQRTVFLHRELLGLPHQRSGIDVDHISRDRLDNRRSNLRAATRSENCQNHPGYGGSSKYRNVAWSKQAQKWHVSIRVDGKQVFLGRYDSEQEAAEVARQARVRLLPYAVD